jgi:hypothetical protein
MSTRCQIALNWTDADKSLDENIAGLDKERKDSVLLYHHSDGYPKFQLPKITSFLKEADKRLTSLGYGYWWDPERVASWLIMLSANTYEKPALLGQDGFRQAVRGRGKYVSGRPTGYPVYQPSMNLHYDIEWLYDVFLTSKPFVHGRKDLNTFTIVVQKAMWNRRLSDDKEEILFFEAGRFSSDDGKRPSQSLVKAINAKAAELSDAFHERKQVEMKAAMDAREASQCSS